jgi:hypothetical protein
MSNPRPRSTAAARRAIFGGLTLAWLAALLGACAGQGESPTVVTISHTTPAPVIDMAISPTTLSAGGSITITWTSSNATACEGNGAWSGSLALSNTTGFVTGPLSSGTYTYGVSCTGPGGTGSTNQVVTVGTVPAPSISFAANPATLQPGNAVTLVWSTSNATACTGTGGTGSDGWAATQPTADKGFNTGAINTAGTYTYNLTCTGPGGSEEATKVVTVSAAAAPAAPTISSFSAQPTQIQPGQTTTFTWSSNANSCGASGGSGSDGWRGSEPTSSTGTIVGPIANAGTYSYTLTCSGAGGNSANNLQLVVSSSPQPPPVIVNLSVLPTQIVAGNAASLTWSTSNAGACTASGSWSGSKPLVGNAVSTQTLTTAGVYTFTLTCTGTGSTSGVGSATLTVTPAPAAVAGFMASPTSIQTNQATLLSWSTTGATSCTASGGVGNGSDGWSGSVATSSAGISVGPITSAGTYTYSLACTGPGGAGAPQSVNVTVTSPTPPPAAAATGFTVTPSTLYAGSSASLTWGSTDAASCTASGGTGSDGWSGSVGTSSTGFNTGTINTAGTYTYTLTCTGPGGTGSPTSVALNVTAPPPAATVATFTASPTTLQTGQAASLAWTSNGATSCAATGGTGSDGWNGSVGSSSSGTSTGTIGTAGSYTYTLTCTGPGGTGAPSSVTLNVTNPPGAAASIGSFTAASSTLTTGQGTTLSWTTTNATSCTASGGLGGSDGWTGTVPTSSSGTSIGPFSNAGTYTYTLNCTGPGGASGANSISINVTSPPPAATVNRFSASPSTMQTGQASTLSWSSNNATACAAIGGTGSWGGSVGTSSTGFSTGVINTAGTYTYTLACTGPGGTGPSSSTIINVTSAPPPAATVSTFTAVPNTIVAGQSTSLSWSTANATSCAATGGTGSDGWNGSVGTSSVGTSTGAIGTAGAYTYTLTCTGPGGTGSPVSVTVDVTAAPVAPTINAFTVTPPTVQTGQSLSASWSTSNATACTASGGTGSDGWSGTVATSSSGTTVGPVTPAGSYTYVLTCTGAGGASAPSSAGVTVTNAPVAPTIGSFTASPVAIQTGGSTVLSWSSSNASSCTAGGGTGSWGGTVATSSSGTTIGPINTAGIYIFTLTCTGTGGTSAPGTATVTVSTAAPAASILTFTALPATLTVGGSTVLSWTTSGASACTASGGTGTDGWNGSQSTLSLGKTVGPINTAGLYVYTLNCTGPGGASSPASVDVTVNSATPAASVGSFAASPATVTVGQSTSLAWSTSNATSCTAGGGSGSDAFSGTVAPSSTGTAVGPFPSAGTVTYTLTCTGAGGASSPATTTVTVNAAAPQQPTVALKANGHSSLTITPGSTASLSWISTNATSCAASGGAGADNWSGSQPTSSSGVSVGPDATPGIYTYTLTCTGTGGSGSSSVQITVMSSNSVDCGLPSVQTTSLVSPAASVLSNVTGLCIGCTVLNPNNVITSTTNSPTSIAELAGVLGGSASVEVTDNSADFPAGRQVGFIVTDGSSLLSLTALSDVTITTYLNGVVQQAATTGNNLIQLQALGLLSVNSNAGFAGFTATKPFNQVAIQEVPVLGVATTLNIYRACISLQ